MGIKRGWRNFKKNGRGEIVGERYSKDNTVRKKTLFVLDRNMCCTYHRSIAGEMLKTQI